MKTFVATISLYFLAASVANANGGPGVTLIENFQPKNVTINGSYSQSFNVNWSCSDYPQSSVPGEVDLYDGNGNFVGSVVATVYSGSVSLTVSGPGSVSNVSASISIYAEDGEPAVGNLSGTWNISGLPAGNYQFRFLFGEETQDYEPGGTVTTQTTDLGGSGPPPSAPTISWTSSPGTVASGQTYTVSAHGHDDAGALTAVSIWKNGQPFAFAGGGNGTDGDSSNPTSDTGPQTVTFTAQAFDSYGNASPVISQTVTIEAADQPPTIAWTSTPGTVASGQTYFVSAQAYAPSGNLTQVNIWKNGQPFAFAGGGNGTTGDSSNPTSDTGPQTVTFTAQAVDAAGNTSPVISQTVTIEAPDQPPTITWTSTPGTVASGQTYTVSAQGYAPSGNLTQVNIWKNAQPFAFAGGGNGTTGNSSNPTSDTGPQAVTFTAQAVDAAGNTSPVISQTVTVNAPPPTQYTLATSAATGGSVSPGGVFAAGSAVTVTASPDNLHNFAGWSGDASGMADPTNLTMNSNRTVQANFSLANFSLTTSATPGGTVTPGGVYQAGTTVTVSESPDSAHIFSGWTGNASGTAPAIAITLNSSEVVQAVFVSKAAQTITFDPPGNVSSSSGPFGVTATSSSGLPVTFTVLTGPATLNGSTVQVTGPGTVTIQASQAGNAAYLPATPVTQTFNAIAPVSLRYNGPSRALLDSAHVPNGVPLLIQAP